MNTYKDLYVAFENSFSIRAREVGIFLGMSSGFRAPKSPLQLATQ